MELQLFTVDPITRHLIWGIRPKFLTGVPFLIQRVVLSILNSKGQDVLEPLRGAGIPDLTEYNIDVENPTEIFQELARRVKAAQDEILSDQIGSFAASEEKLVSIDIIKIEQGANIDEINARIRIVNQANQRTDVVL